MLIDFLIGVRLRSLGRCKVVIAKTNQMRDVLLKTKGPFIFVVGNFGEGTRTGMCTGQGVQISTPPYHVGIVSGDDETLLAQVHYIC